MSPLEAEDIVCEFGGIIGARSSDKRVSDVRTLPHSPAKIKYAYFVYTEYLINEGLFTDDIKQKLEVTYAIIDSTFVESDVDKINNALKNYAKDEKAREFLKEKGGVTAFIPSLESMVEYNNFVADCYGNWNKK